MKRTLAATLTGIATSAAGLAFAGPAVAAESQQNSYSRFAAASFVPSIRDQGDR